MGTENEETRRNTPKRLGGKHAGIDWRCTRGQKTCRKRKDLEVHTHQADDFGFRMGVIPIPINEDVARVEVRVDEIVRENLQPILICNVLSSEIR